MSRTMTISSWPSSKTAWSTSEGSPCSPAVTSSYMRATLAADGLSGSKYRSLTSRRSVRGEGVLGAGDAGLALRATAVGVGVAGTRGHDPARWALDHRGEDLGQLLLDDGLLLHQHVDHLVGHVPVAGEDLLGLEVGLVDQPPHLLVDLERHLLRVILLV